MIFFGIFAAGFLFGGICSLAIVIWAVSDDPKDPNRYRSNSYKYPGEE